MLTLLAESKTMSGNQVPVPDEDFIKHKPVFEIQADEIMSLMAQKSPAEIASILGISNQLAIKAHSLAYDFPHKITGYKAVDGFIGEAYRGLDIKSIGQDKLTNLNDKVRIISSVYGLLKPEDVIKPYRCDFNKKICADNKTPIQVFKSKNTIELVNYIKGNKVKEIIDLLPADADSCLDWKIIRAFSSVYKVCFQLVTSEGKLKTPIAKRLKELRGLMCRFILENEIQSFEQLISIESADFVYSPKDSKTGFPVFISD